MKSICGANCCECELYQNKKCLGCLKTKACPFGKKCFIANYIEVGGRESFEKFKEKLLKEINSFSIEGLPEVKELYPLLGSFINVEVPIPNNQKVKFLEDEEIYLGNQVECLFHEELFFGIVANTNFIMIIQYEINGENPELILYQKR